MDHPAEADGEIIAYDLPGGKAAMATHVGPYATLSQTYDALAAWVKEQNFEPSGAMWEEYLTDPNAEPDPAKWRTNVYIPVN